MALVSNGLANQSYYETLEREVSTTARYVEEHGVRFNHNYEKL